MDHSINNKAILDLSHRSTPSYVRVDNLSQGFINTEYTIKEINSDDLELISFLFSLGCYVGEKITIISKLADNFVLSVKDARYSIDKDLAEVIILL